MIKVIVFGIGDMCKRQILSNRKLCENIEIVAFSDNNFEYWGMEFSELNKKVIRPEDIPKYEFDRIVVTPLKSDDIRKQLIGLGIDPRKFISIQELFNNVLYKEIKLKYNETKDVEIQRMLGAFKRDGLSVYGDYINEDYLYQVYRESDNNPYIICFGEKMYFPKSTSFIEKDGKEYMYDVISEQQDESPHLYIKNDNDVKNGAVIVDGGVCEGNFSLRYVEKAKKIYLIECDEEWLEALKLTFEPWKDKCVFCNKMLGRFDTSNVITLDSLVHEKIDFLKLDIEGAEIDALLGARRVLQSSNAKCAICSYHKQYDEKYIKYLLESYGYNTSVSKGYMLFYHDHDLLDTLDFRHGIVYGDKS
jgi:hypothetical protein